MGYGGVKMNTAKENPMKEVRIEKITLNIGVGAGGEPLEKASTLLNRVSGAKPVVTLAKVRNPTFHIKKGDPIGTKVTLRGKRAEDVLKNSLKASGNQIPKKSFDVFGNVSFGVKEYIDFPGLKYDPDLGIMGFDVCITLVRPGRRVSVRRRMPGKVGKSHKIKKEEAMKFMIDKFKIDVE